MKFKSTLIGFGVALLLGLYAYFVEFKRSETETVQKENESKVVQLAKDDIVKVAVTFPNKAKPDYVIEKKGEEWHLTQPISYVGDNVKISGMLTTLTTQKKDLSIGDDIKELDKFGLKPAEVSVKVTDKAGKEASFDFGIDVPTQWSSYVVLSGSASVFTASKSFRNAFDRDANDLRDKKVIHLDKSKIAKVSVSGASMTSWVAEKDGDRWQIKQPIAVTTEANLWNDWMNDHATVTAEEFTVEGKPTDAQLKKYGFSRPALKVSFFDDKGAVLSDLLIGRVQDDPKDKARFTLYAMTMGGAIIFKLPNGQWDRLSKSYSALLMKKPLTFVSTDATEMSLQHGTAQVLLKKDAATNSWKLQEGTAMAEVDQQKVADYIKEVLEFEVDGTEWVSGDYEKASKGAATWRVEVRGMKDGKAESLATLFGLKKTGSKQTVYMSSMKKAAALIDSTKTAKFAMDASYFKVETKPEPVSPPSTPASQTKEGAWKMLEPTVKDKSEIKKLDKAFVDANKKYLAKFETSKGSFEIEFFAKEAPYTVSNFLNLARNKYYDGLKFHRVIAGFMAQGGDPTGSGSGGPGYKFQDEFSAKKHERGSLSMANAGPNTNGSQFFICFAPQSHLDGKHSVFGQVVGEGMKVVDQLKNGDVMTTVRVFEQ